jgi:hypothetical protein
MEFIPKNLAEGQLPATKTTLYTVPALKTAIIQSICLVNVAGATRTVNIYYKKGTSRRIIPQNLTLIAGAKVDDNTQITLDAGDQIEGDCSAATSVDFVISGVETR